MNTPKEPITTTEALIAATRDKDIRHIAVSGLLTGSPSFRLAPGQSLRGTDGDACIAFAAEGDGVQLTSDNRIDNIRLEASPQRGAIFNDTGVGTLGRIELQHVTTTGRVQI